MRSKDPNAGRAPRAVTNQRPRRKARAARRDAFHADEVAFAPNGFVALSTAYDWIRAELQRVEEDRPGEAERIARQLAVQLAQYAPSIRKSRGSSAA